MTKKIIALIFIIACIFSIPFQAFGNEESKNIIVLNSYQRGLSWTDSINQGIIDNFNEDAEKNHVFVEYMDWKNYPTAKNLENIYNFLLYKYKNKKVDLIITTDDAALIFAIEHRDELFSNAPIVFTGVNEENAKKLTEGQTKINGIIEKQHTIHTLELAKQLYPNLKEVYVLFDDSESGVAMGEEAIKDLKEYDPNLKILKNEGKDLAGILDEINGLPEDAVVFLSVFYQDTKGTILGFDRNAKYIIENTKSIPFFSLYHFTFDQGTIGGCYLCGKIIGEQAYYMANDVLNGKEFNSNITIDQDTCAKEIDYHAMQDLGISIKQIPEGYTIINKPTTIMDEYRNVIYGIIGAFVLLLFFTGLQFYYIRKQIILKKALEEKNKEQKLLFEELAISEEELQAQFEEIAHTNTQLQITKKELEDLAYNDNLTGLENRAGIFAYFDEITKREDCYGAILLLDIDDFKHINDSYGHIFGDRIIKEAGSRLNGFISHPSKVYRAGGDEFLIYLHFKTKDEAEKTAKDITHLFNTPIIIETSHITISFSIGISVYPNDGFNLNQILSKADIAMYESKHKGKKKHTAFTEAMLERISKRRMIEENLEKALEKKELFIHYQPQLSLKDNTIWGFEALLRWKNPYLGNVPPLDFINIAEKNQMIIPIGNFVLDQACKFIKKLQNQYGKDFKVSINVSVVQIMQDHFVETVLGAIEKHHLSYDSVEIEITESILMELFENSYEKLKSLKDKGVRIALDDFGTGYSSLNYIKQLPLTALKIDKSFIDNIEGSATNRELVGVIIELARLMELDVVAEGIETKEQFEYLKEKKSNRIQGYYYARPIPEEEIIEFVEGVDNNF